MSASTPVSTVSVAGLGEVRLSACPGTWTGEGGAAALDADLAAIRASGATGLISLIEAHEFPLGIEEFSRRTAAAQLDWVHLPIADFGTPDTAFDRAYARMDVLGRVTRGEIWAIHCRAGLGRTGTVAARLLVEAGLAPLEAIEAVRSAHDRRAIETEEQRQYILSLSHGVGR